nr:RNA polymerase sigma factor [Novosphingobium panipatense]
MRHAIVAYVVRKGHSRDAAEDVAQESLTKLLRYARQGRPASLYGLALKIAANSLIDLIRGETRFGAPVDDTFPCEAPLPDTVVADRQQLRLLSVALEHIPPLRRAVLVRRRVENQSHARIAAEMGLSVAAVEKHVVRGLCDLRKAMEDRGSRDRITS